jgi:hypothetical protein
MRRLYRLAQGRYRSAGHKARSVVEAIALELHLDGVHEQAGLAGDFLVCHALGSENCRKSCHLQSPEMVRLFTVKPQKRLGAAFHVSGAPIGGELQQCHVLSVLAGESLKNYNTLGASPSQRLNGCSDLPRS